MDPARDATQGHAGGPKRALALGTAVIAVFAVVAVALVRAMGDADGDVRTSESRGEPAAADPARIAAPPLPPPQPGAAARAPAPAAPPRTPEEVDAAWRDTPIVSRLRDELGPVGPYVYAGLRHAQEETRHCWGGRAPTRGGAAATEDAVGPPAVLLLYLEAREGAIDVVDARVADPGTASPDVVECCRGVLKGREFQVPNAQPGRRYRLEYALQ
ncbi:MAG TPA: hypothetical protein VFL83_10645 [Anaeromyxobacter sp.]|nr:hypothetical protein [Anaeromyxobacter sp.]